MSVLAVIFVTGLCILITKMSDGDHTQVEAECAIKLSIAILETKNCPA